VSGLRTGRPNRDRVVAAIVPMPPLTGAEPCRDRTEHFFPDAYTRDQPEVRVALLECRRCPLAPVCLVWALANPRLSQHGIWGATTPRQRTALRTKVAARVGADRVDDTYRTAYATAVDQLHRVQ
jgi:WhiB family redox-sensing transcriptional regulator